MKINPLNHIKIASPCSANWDEMLGDKRQRFCTECKLNVYNLSEMTQREAEKFLFEAEGRVCVRLYKRSDGTVITQDCPVGWAAIKRRVSRIGAATFSIIVGFFGGLFAVSQTPFDNSKLLEDISIEKDERIETGIFIEEGSLTYEKPITQMGSLPIYKNEIKKRSIRSEAFVGRVENIRDLKDESVELWIK